MDFSSDSILRGIINSFTEYKSFPVKIMAGFGVVSSPEAILYSYKSGIADLFYHYVNIATTPVLEELIYYEEALAPLLLKELADRKQRVKHKESSLYILWRKGKLL